MVGAQIMVGAQFTSPQAREASFAVGAMLTSPDERR
jgi:hypothetical protein